MLQKRQGRDPTDQLILRFPTPESQYPYHQPHPSTLKQCGDMCDKQYCLSDICLTSIMTDCHFPRSRPVAVPVSHIDLNVEYKPK